MPEYEFRSERTGEVRSFVYRMADAPPIGSCVDRDGDRWVRIPSQPVLASDGFNGVWGYPAVCPSLPNTIPEGLRDKKGRVVVRSAAEHRNICAKYGYAID